MHPVVLRICAAFVIFPFAVILHPTRIPAQNSSENHHPKENRVWLAVEERSRAQLLSEPIATVEASVLTPVQASCLSDTLTLEDFSSKLFCPKFTLTTPLARIARPPPGPSLIASFSLDAGDNQGLLHSVFLVASQLGEKLQPEFLWIHLSESETDEEHLRFVDHADLFGNGQDEVVAKLVSLETQTHRCVVFRRTKDGAHLGTNFQNRAVGLFVVSAQEK